MLKRVLLTLLITGATLVLIATVAAVVLIKPEKLKGQLITQLQNRTGYVLTAGPASLALGWHGAGIKVHQINAQSPDSSVVIAMDDLAAFVKLRPLLHHQVALEHVSLGKPTYVLRLGTVKPAPAPQSPGGHATSLAQLGIDSWSVSDGSFKQYEPGRGEFTLSGIDMGGGLNWANEAGFNGTASGTIKQGVFFAAGRPWPFENLKINTDFRLSSAADSIQVQKMELGISGLKGTFKGGYARRNGAWVGDVRGSVDQAAWSKFESFLTPLAVSLKRFNVDGSVGLPDVHLWRTANGQNNVEGTLSVVDLSVKMQGAPAGLSQFHGTAHFTPETVTMKGGKGVVAGQPLALDLNMTGTSPRKVRAHVVTSLPGAVAGQLIPKDKPITLSSGSLNVDVVLERAFPGQGLPTWAGRVQFQGLSGTLNKLPFAEGSGNLTMNGMAADIQALHMKIGRSDLTVHGTIPDVTNPWFNFSLVADVLDVDELTAKAEATGDMSSTDASGKPKRSPLGIAGQGPARVGMLHFKGQDYREVTAQVRLDQAGITMDNLTGRAFGGSVAGNLRVAPRDGHWTYDGKLTGKDMTASTVLGTFAPRANIVEGRLNGVVDLSGQAGIGVDPKKTLSLIADATLSGGGFKNFTGLSALSKYINASDLTAQSWPIQNLATHMEVRDGAAVFKNLHLTQSGLDWDLAGAIGFDGGLNVQGSLRALPDRLKIPSQVAPYMKYLVHSDGKIAIDFKLTGKSSSPNVILDWDDLLKHAAGKFAQDEAANLIQQQIQKAIQGNRPISPADTSTKAKADSLRKIVPFPTKVDSLQPNVLDQLKNLFGKKSKAAPAKPKTTPVKAESTLVKPESTAVKPAQAKP
jgi:hypothetical protein